MSVEIIVEVHANLICSPFGTKHPVGAVSYKASLYSACLPRIGDSISVARQIANVTVESVEHKIFNPETDRGSPPFVILRVQDIIVPGAKDVAQEDQIKTGYLLFLSVLDEIVEPSSSKGPPIDRGWEFMTENCCPCADCKNGATRAIKEYHY